MKTASLWASLATTALIALPSQAQFCSQSDRNGLSGNTISFTVGTSFAGVVQAAIDQWSSSCPGSAGQKYPSLAVNSSQSDANPPIAIYYHSESGPRCGATSFYTPFPGSTPVPVEEWSIGPRHTNRGCLRYLLCDTTQLNR